MSYLGGFGSFGFGCAVGDSPCAVPTAISILILTPSIAIKVTGHRGERVRVRALLFVFVRPITLIQGVVTFIECLSLQCHGEALSVLQSGEFI